MNLSIEMLSTVYIFIFSISLVFVFLKGSDIKNCTIVSQEPSETCIEINCPETVIKLHFTIS